MNIPVDPSISHEVLGNGLELFVQDNKKPAGTLELRLVLRVGSLVEVN